MGLLWGFYGDYPLVNQHNYGQSPFLMNKSSINGPFSIAMLVYQRVMVILLSLMVIFW
jgi:hypothetical protein